ncbi:MAG: molybdate ABC transporter substrate-binding protein [Acinetobacter sp.]|jgi:molybdate transport system substrate-binding protein|nr:MAG: molybdate ABC transporter substrate-binding protein [Acinetobacter sp.]
MKKIVLFSLSALMSVSAFADTVRIHAAASLTNAITDIATAYQKQNPQTKIVPVFGASSNLARQIENGLPSDLFFSADMDWANYLVEKNQVNQNQVKPILFNQLVAISPKNLNIPFRASTAFNFPKAFTGHLCTGQMESVPVGKYAKQSLIKLNWLEGLKGRIVGTDDVRSALAFVERGECQVGIVYKTDALISQKVKIIGTFPSDSHSSITYPVALTKQGESNADAVKFSQFIRSNPKAKMIFQQYGFTVKP